MSDCTELTARRTVTRMLETFNGFFTRSGTEGSSAPLPLHESCNGIQSLRQSSLVRSQQNTTVWKGREEVGDKMRNS